MTMGPANNLSAFLTRKHSHSFRLFDANNDGFVERADHDRIVSAACHARGLTGADAEAFHAQLAGIWEALEQMVDRDGDHRINLTEWLAFQGGMAANPQLWQTAVEGNIRQFLALFDLDGDGGLSPAEYALLLGAYGLPASVAQAAFPRLDLGGDGVISTEDLLEVVRQWSFGEDPSAPGTHLFGALPA